MPIPSSQRRKFCFSCFFPKIGDSVTNVGVVPVKLPSLQNMLNIPPLEHGQEFLALFIRSFLLILRQVVRPILSRKMRKLLFQEFIGGIIVLVESMAKVLFNQHRIIQKTLVNQENRKRSSKNRKVKSVVRHIRCYSVVIPPVD